MKITWPADLEKYGLSWISCRLWKYFLVFHVISPNRHMESSLKTQCLIITCFSDDMQSLKNIWYTVFEKIGFSWIPKWCDVQLATFFEICNSTLYTICANFYIARRNAYSKFYHISLKINLISIFFHEIFRNVVTKCN